MLDIMPVEPIRIGNRRVGPGFPAYVIAEIGFNHGGDIGLALAMIDAAAAAGTDAVKFQSYQADRLVLRGNPHFELIRGGELTRKDHDRLSAAASAKGVDFMSTPYDEERVGWLEEVGSPAIKIASMDLTNFALLARAAEGGLPVIVSTGMATASEVDEALAQLDAAGASGVILLHCVSHYPADIKSARVATVADMAARFHRPIGYSDHVIGPMAAVAAVALGACVIEKHFTTDKNLPGPDHVISADPDDLEAMVQAIRDVESALGTSVFDGERPDRPNARLFRRGVHASRALPASTVLGAADLKVVRPEGGCPPGDLQNLFGRKTLRDIADEEPVSPDMLG